MKGEKLQDAIGMIDDDMIMDADSANQKSSGGKKAGTLWLKYAGAVAAVVVMAITAVAVFNYEPDKGSEGATNKSEMMNNAGVDRDENINGDKENETTVIVDKDNTSDVPNKPIVDEKPMDLHTFALSQSVYPTMTKCPYFNAGGNYTIEESMQWRADKSALRVEYLDMNINQDKFYTSTIREFLSDSDGENVVYSPVNVYMALSMLSEVTDGNSRKQLLDLIGVDDIETLRNEANAIWKANYSDDGLVKSVLASSLWLRNDTSYKEETLKSLSDIYYASVYNGVMGDAEYDKALQTWLNEQTGNMLKEQIGDIRMSPNTVMSLATTIYYKAKWTHEFGEAPKRTFHGSAGDELCDFMISEGNDVYYWGENFTAVSHSFDESGAMWFVLPNEGVTVDELLMDDEAMRFLISDEKDLWENKKNYCIKLEVPKFDVSSQIDLKTELEKLGVTDIMDPLVADFGPLTDSVTDMFLSSASHGARVLIDEKGCEASAYTILVTEGTAISPKEKIDFVVNRPFIFTITSDVDMPLFVGVVNNVK